jgi:hypothetical protein
MSPPQGERITALEVISEQIKNDVAEVKHDLFGVETKLDGHIKLSQDRHQELIDIITKKQIQSKVWRGMWSKLWIFIVFAGGILAEFLSGRSGNSGPHN